MAMSGFEVFCSSSAVAEGANEVTDTMTAQTTPQSVINVPPVVTSIYETAINHATCNVKTIIVSLHAVHIKCGLFSH